MIERVPEISVVSPVYKAENLIVELVDRLRRALEPISPDYEIILVEDGSPDASWAEITRACVADVRVRGIHLSRNFGQHPAIMAGLRASRGRWVVVMDCDLQDRPEEIGKLYTTGQNGFDIVYALRVTRQDSSVKRLLSRSFYAVLSYLTDTEQDHRIANFGIYRRKTIEAVLSMNEPFKFFPIMVRWTGFRTTSVVVEHAARPRGQSSYKFRQLFRLASGLATSYSDKPLRLTVRLGLAISVFSFGLGLYYLFQFLRGEIVVLGFASLIISIWFLSGLIIFVLGILGLYLGKTFETAKARPPYLIHETRNFDP
jgi:dolichol-phosphate mannosyltransferase